MTSVPKSAEFIGGHGVNANLGICTKMYRKTLETWGIKNRNMKGRRLPRFFSQQRLKVTNSFYKKPSFVTWRSFGNSKSPHMLDLISGYETFFKCVRNCGVSPRGMRSDHLAVALEFMNRSIKYKSTFVKRQVIDWKSIKECEEVNKKFNFKLMTKIQEPFSYTQYNEAILQSAEETAMTESDVNHGWYHFSRDTLTSTLESRNTLLHSIWADPGNATPSTLHRLEHLQHKVDKEVDLAKTIWSRHLAREIHNNNEGR